MLVQDSLVAEEEVAASDSAEAAEVAEVSFLRPVVAPEVR